MDGQSVVERTQGLVHLLELLADREALGTVLLAFSALDTLGGKGRFLCESPPPLAEVGHDLRGAAAPDAHRGLLRPRKRRLYGQAGFPAPGDDE